MNSQAMKLMEKHEHQARARAQSAEIGLIAKKARGDLEAACAMGIAIFEAAGEPLDKASAKMLSPNLGLLIETSVDRVVQKIYAGMDYEQSCEFNKDLSPLEALQADSVGHFALWAFDDGSAWISLKLHEREVAASVIEASSMEGKAKIAKGVWELWCPGLGPLGAQIGAKLMAAGKARRDLCALTPEEALALAKCLPSGWSEGSSWAAGVSIKALSSGAQTTPAEFTKQAIKALGRGKEEQLKLGMRKMDEMRKEREARMKIHWRDAMCIFMSQAQALPAYDGGMAPFLMSKPGLFGQYPMPVWRKMFGEISDQVKILADGESPDIAAVERASAILGQETSSQLAHFLYRHHRAGGAKQTAKKVFEQAKERILAEAGRGPRGTGLAAAVREREIASTEDRRESSKAASSVEYSTQYGAAIALLAALWAKETGFSDISMQARLVARIMRGEGEISMECFGWFAKLMFEFGEGFVEREDIARALQKEMEEIARLAEEEKRRGGKISIENEWSGNWGAELAGRKVREYLDLERGRSSGEQA